jgi:hypothetical protein
MNDHFVRITNFYSLLLNLHDFPDDYSPDYILEKWDHWIGKDIILKNTTVPIESVVQFKEYIDKWKINTDDLSIYGKIQPIFYFLSGNKNMNMRNNFADFTHFGGDIAKVSCQEKTGLHFLVKKRLNEYLKLNEKLITAYIREIKLASILD